METYIGYLEQNSLFYGLTREELKKIIERCRRVSFEKDQAIFSEGEFGDTMYVVMEGEVSIQKRIGMGARELKRLTPGCCFGEMSLLSKEKRSASARATRPTMCIELHRTEGARLLHEIYQLNYNVMRVLSRRMKRSEELANKEILEAYKTLIFSLSNLTESRDPETGAHLSRVRDYCRFLAEKLAPLPGFSDMITPIFIREIYNVSPLHDIGKVGVSDSILLKPGRLTDEEFEVMKTHAHIGAKTMRGVLNAHHHPTFQMAYNIIHYHHERYDGSGYPLGLSERGIPLEARIMALADVYDALLSRRVYKKPFTYREARRIIKRGSGTQFDPDITEVMLGDIGNFERIHMQYADEV
ncbi:MAG: cyclic nucleotide-binding domain-containing protein [Desulfobacterales bacterium]|nr:cyclic nucleotide-binding domain-containing protein [Desulfobacterales bacterium]